VLNLECKKRFKMSISGCLVSIKSYEEQNAHFTYCNQEFSEL